MNEKHLPKSYWAKAANTTIYLMNRSTISEVHNLAPYKKFYEKKPDLSDVKILLAVSDDQAYKVGAE